MSLTKSNYGKQMKLFNVKKEVSTIYNIMSLTKINYKKQMKIFNVKKEVSNKIQLSPKETPIEEQEKELLYWESQYDKLFDIIEKKRQDRSNKIRTYNNICSFSLTNKNQNNSKTNKEQNKQQTKFITNN
mgnify:CR=1 FL=1